MILYGKTDTTYAFCLNVLQYWNHWISMGLLSKNCQLRSIIFLNVFHNVVFLKSLNTYGITNKVLYLISMFSMMLYQWNHWNSYGMARKMLHIMYIYIYTLIIHPNIWKSLFVHTILSIAKLTPPVWAHPYCFIRIIHMDHRLYIIQMYV